MLCAKFGWNLLSGSGEEDFLILSMFFRDFCNDLPLEKGGALHLNKLETPSPKDALCLIGWNWSCGSGEEDENMKSLQTDGQTDKQTDDGRQVIRKAHLSFQLRWAKNVINKMNANET